MITLNENELKTLIKLVAEVTVTVKDAPKFIGLINKMSDMIDELKEPQEGTTDGNTE